MKYKIYTSLPFNQESTYLGFSKIQQEVQKLALRATQGCENVIKISERIYNKKYMNKVQGAQN